MFWLNRKKVDNWIEGDSSNATVIMLASLNIRILYNEKDKYQTSVGIDIKKNILTIMENRAILKGIL